MSKLAQSNDKFSWIFLLGFSAVILALMIYSMDQFGTFDDEFWYYHFPFAVWILGEKPNCPEFTEMIWEGKKYRCQPIQFDIPEYTQEKVTEIPFLTNEQIEVVCGDLEFYNGKCNYNPLRYSADEFERWIELGRVIRLTTEEQCYIITGDWNVC